MHIIIEQAEGVVGQLERGTVASVSAADEVVRRIRTKFEIEYPRGNAGYYKTDVWVDGRYFRLDVNELTAYAPIEDYLTAQVNPPQKGLYLGVEEYIMVSRLEWLFVQGVARALFVQAWVCREERSCTHLMAAVSPDLFNPCGLAEEAEIHQTYQFGWHTFKGRSFAGQELMDAAPETPRYVVYKAWKFLGVFEDRNPQWRCNLSSICAAAARADRVEFPQDGDGPAFDARLSDDEVSAFGNDIAMQALGHGVGWFYYHAKFELHVPDVQFQLKG